MISILDQRTHPDVLDGLILLQRVPVPCTCRIRERPPGYKHRVRPTVRAIPMLELPSDIAEESNKTKVLFSHLCDVVHYELRILTFSLVQYPRNGLGCRPTSSGSQGRKDSTCSTLILYGGDALLS